MPGKNDAWVGNFLDGPDVLVCIKDHNQAVRYQNTPCRKLCGQREGMVCTDHCMARYVHERYGDSNRLGTQHFPSQEIAGELYDIVFINNGDCLVSVLVPLAASHDAELKFLSGYNLTKREREIVECVIQGKSNAEIARMLYISKSTLKTHLNRIYRKLPEHITVAWRDTRHTPAQRESHVRLRATDPDD